MNVLEVTGLGKAYKQYPRRRSRLLEWLDPRNKAYHHLHWVLKDINFSVKAGEALGIIGVNGAGKSTLLKMITGTTKPTIGQIQVHGRVAALLELGMGFHPDFTGRQNVFMAGQLMGHTVDELKQLMPEIEEFAEIGEYINQPVRVYSSGMQVRLAFSLATAKRPDILIVDEALSVGDAYFQHKSFERIREFQKKGTTLLIVSHDRGAIQSLCNLAILINKGKIDKTGKPEEVFDYYNAIISDISAQTIKINPQQNGKKQTTSGSRDAEILDVSLRNKKQQSVETIYVGEPVELVVTVTINKPIKNLVLGYAIKDRLGHTMYGTNTWHTGQVIQEPLVKNQYQFCIKFNANLGPGSYSIAVALHESLSHINNNFDWRDLAYLFQVINNNKTVFEGCNWLEPSISV
jgi:lipopolysaccharide transport system ATP-binding protein